MSKQKVIILLIGLMSYGSTSGFFSVICHGSDGHIALEPVVHTHCEHPETTRITVQGILSDARADTPAEHAHCKDTMVTLEAPLPTQKNGTLSVYPCMVTPASLKQILSHTPHLFTHREIAWLCESFRFHEPLRTIVLRT